MFRERNVFVVLKKAFLNAIFTVETFEDAHSGENPAGTSAALVLGGGACSIGHDVRSRKDFCGRVHHRLDYVVDLHALVCDQRVKDHNKHKTQCADSQDN